MRPTTTLTPTYYGDEETSDNESANGGQSSGTGQTVGNESTLSTSVIDAPYVSQTSTPKAIVDPMCGALSDLNPQPTGQSTSFDPNLTMTTNIQKGLSAVRKLLTTEDVQRTAMALKGTRIPKLNSATARRKLRDDQHFDW